MAARNEGNGTWGLHEAQGCLRADRLLDEEQGAPAMTILIKRSSFGKSLEIPRAAGDMHGGDGIYDKYQVIRHMINLGPVRTCEGTQDVRALILGRAQTGSQAFS